MIRLDARDYDLLLPLYAASEIDFPLIEAVLRGAQPGVVHVDHPERPTLALAINNFGFTYLFGEGAYDRPLANVFESLFAMPALQGRYLLWYNPPPYCRNQMDMMGENIARSRTRVRFTFSPERFGKQDPLVSKIPQQAEIVRIDDSVLGEADVFQLDMGDRFWGSKEAFLNKGFGFAVRFNGKLASVCYSACVISGVAEIDIATLEDSRGRGFARAVGARFVRDCINSGVVPNWDCFDYNEPSRRLAERLGFVERTRYPFYSIIT